MVADDHWQGRKGALAAGDVRTDGRADALSPTLRSGCPLLWGETTPLLLLIGGAHRTMTRGAVHLIIKQVFDNAIGHLQSTGEAHERAADRLRRASAHWLRHTTGSRMMDGQVDLRYVRDNLGHDSISTSSQYLHADDDDRHRATEAGLRLNW